MATFLPGNISGSARQPQIIYTNGYLNDPIEFTVDPRFDPKVLIPLVSHSILQYDRDQAEFLKVEINSTSSRYDSIQMYTPFYNKLKVAKVIDREFTTYKTVKLFRDLSNG